MLGGETERRSAGSCSPVKSKRFFQFSKIIGGGNGTGYTYRQPEKDSWHTVHRPRRPRPSQLRGIEPKSFATNPEKKAMKTKRFLRNSTQSTDIFTGKGQFGG